MKLSSGGAPVSLRVPKSYSCSPYTERLVRPLGVPPAAVQANPAQGKVSVLVSYTRPRRGSAMPKKPEIEKLRVLHDLHTQFEVPEAIRKTLESQLSAD